MQALSIEKKRSESKSSSVKARTRKSATFASMISPPTTSSSKKPPPDISPNSEKTKRGTRESIVYAASAAKNLGKRAAEKADAATMKTSRFMSHSAKKLAAKTAAAAITSTRISTNVAVTAANKANQIRKDIRSGEMRNKNKILRPERIKALIEVFEKGSATLGILPNQHKVKELKRLLGLSWEADTACWVAGSAIRAQRSTNVRANCFICQTTLTLFCHHCRRCGTLVCDSCSQERCSLNVYWDEDDYGDPCLRVVSTKADKNRLRTCDRCITDMIHQQKTGEGLSKMKEELMEKDRALALLSNKKQQSHILGCVICGNKLPLNSKWVHPSDHGTNADTFEDGYWRKEKKASSKNVCVNCVLEKRHEKGYLQTYDLSLTHIHPQADSMDILDAIERKFSFTVHDINISMDATKNPKMDEHGKIHCIVTVNNADTRRKLIEMKELEILIPCGLQKNALIRVWPRASTKEQLKKLGEPVYSFFRSNKLGYADMTFLRKNSDSYTLKYNTREKTFLMDHIVIAGRRPTAENPDGVRLENGYCLVSKAYFEPKRNVSMDHNSVLTLARRTANDHALTNHEKSLERRAHRAHGHDFRCFGAPDCVPDSRKKQYCMTCGGVRFSRVDMLHGRLSTADAIIEAIRHDDVLRLRACTLLRVSKQSGSKQSGSKQSGSKQSGSKQSGSHTNSLKTAKTGEFFFDITSVKGPIGSTAVHMCCQYRATDCLDFMFRLQETHHSNMFACVDMNGATPLTIAARIGWSVKKLVRNGSPEILRIPDGFGRLPIHYAAIRGDINDLKELLHAGSKHYQLNKVDSQYKRAIDLINTTELNGTRAFKYLTREMEKCDIEQKKKTREYSAGDVEN
jgi:hypothetical protein